MSKKKKFLYTLSMTLAFLFYQFIFGRLMEWYAYVMYFALLFLIVNTKFWGSFVTWAKKKDEEIASRHHR